MRATAQKAEAKPAPAKPAAAKAPDIAAASVPDTLAALRVSPDTRRARAGGAAPGHPLGVNPVAP